MGLVKEFKEFALRGNMVDLAVGVVIGAAFGKIVTSLVNDIIMPPLGLITGGVDFSNLSIHLKNAIREGDKVVTPAVELSYGRFINNVVDFVIVAVAIFLVIKLMNTAARKKPPAESSGPPPLTMDQQLLTDIRDSLRPGGRA